MADPVIMIDSQNRVVDSNPAARELVGAPDSWRGMDAVAFLGPLSGLQEDENEPGPTEFEVDDGGRTRHFDLDRSRIADTHGQRGQLLVLREITERKAREEVLQTQRDDLEVLNTMMRHDIRNDLQLATAYADLLEDDVAEDNQAYLDQIQSAATEAIDITKSARDVTEVLLSAGGETNPVRLDTVLEAEVAEVSEAYDSGTIELREAVDPVQIEADDMLESVFRNLLTNAVEHNDTDRPEVEVATEIGADTVRISVADDGPGIPPEERESIFAKGETGLESDGTGLGLYLVQTLVDRYDGRVWIEDNEPRGAVFVVELPRVS
ncbi:two-component system sensor histidine kinase NtrB [Halodesulfurarchaeum formicicum]|nr:PAS domain-containing sensor histidine kinase [Halodesulfurarchaeum formicicum]